MIELSVSQLQAMLHESNTMVQALRMHVDNVAQRQNRAGHRK